MRRSWQTVYWTICCEASLNAAASRMPWRTRWSFRAGRAAKSMRARLNSPSTASLGTAMAKTEQTKTDQIETDQIKINDASSNRPATKAPSPVRVAAFRTGLSAEARAAAYLMAKGYRILAKRFRTPHGEIDIVAKRRSL